MIAMIVAVGILASPHSFSESVAAEAHPLPLDLAAMILTPADLALAGLEEFGGSSGRALTVDDLAARVVWPEGDGESLVAARETLLAAGWSQAQAAVLTTVRDFVNPGTISDVEVEVIAYADADGATAGFLLVPDAYPTGDTADVAGSELIGDESRITRIDGHDPGSGTPSQELALGFRTGRLTARVLIRNLSNETPEVTEIEALAKVLESKIELVLGDGAPDLSLRAIHIAPKDAMTFAADEYIRIGSEDVRSAFESATEFASRTAAYGDATDIFARSTEILAGDSSYNLAFSVVLYRFTGETNAIGWLQEMPNQLGHLQGLISISIETSTTSVADEMSMATMERAPGIDATEVVHSAIVFVRVGANVAEIRLDRLYDAPSPAAALDLAQRQADCLRQNDCLDLIPFAVSPTGEPE